MTELRTRMDNDMLVRGMAERTRETYLAAVARLARHYHRSPDQLSAAEVQAYLVHMLREEHLAWSTCNIAVQACARLKQSPSLFISSTEYPSGPSTRSAAFTMSLNSGLAMSRTRKAIVMVDPRRRLVAVKSGW